SASARARMASRASTASGPPIFAASEIELRIMRHRRLARHAIGEQRAERGARFHPRVPFGKGGKFGPGDFAEIIQRRNMGGDGEIGKRDLAAREKAARFRQ